MTHFEPTYLRYIYDGLVKGSIHPENSAELPEGLIGLYEEAFDERVSAIERQKLLRRLAIWTLLKKEVSIGFVAEVLGENEEDIQAFIFDYSSWFNSPEVGKYQLYHEQIKVYLLQKLSQSETEVLHIKLISRLEIALQEQLADEFEVYGLEFLSAHYSVEAMLNGDGSKLIKLAYDSNSWQRQIKISKGYLWTKSGLQYVMTWASKFNNEEVIECGLKMVDLHYEEQNAAPEIIQMVADGDVDRALKRISEFGGKDAEGLQRKSILYMLCLMELTLFDTTTKPHAKETINKIIKHFDDQVPILNIDNFPANIIFQIACALSELGVDFSSFISKWSTFSIHELSMKFVEDSYDILYRILNQAGFEESVRVERIISLIKIMMNNQKRNKIAPLIEDVKHQISQVQDPLKVFSMKISLNQIFSEYNEAGNLNPLFVEVAVDSVEKELDENSWIEDNQAFQVNISLSVYMRLHSLNIIEFSNQKYTSEDFLLQAEKYLDEESGVIRTEKVCKISIEMYLQGKRNEAKELTFSLLSEVRNRGSQEFSLLISDQILIEHKSFELLLISEALRIQREDRLSDDILFECINSAKSIEDIDNRLKTVAYLVIEFNQIRQELNSGLDLDRFFGDSEKLLLKSQHLRISEGGSEISLFKVDPNIEVALNILESTPLKNIFDLYLATLKLHFKQEKYIHAQYLDYLTDSNLKKVLDSGTLSKLEVFGIESVCYYLVGKKMFSDAIQYIRAKELPFGYRYFFDALLSNGSLKESREFLEVLREEVDFALFDIAIIFANHGHFYFASELISEVQKEPFRKKITLGEIKYQELCHSPDADMESYDIVINELVENNEGFGSLEQGRLMGLALKIFSLGAPVSELFDHVRSLERGEARDQHLEIIIEGLVNRLEYTAAHEMLSMIAMESYRDNAIMQILTKEIAMGYFDNINQLCNLLSSDYKAANLSKLGKVFADYNGIERSILQAKILSLTESEHFVNGVVEYINRYHNNFKISPILSIAWRGSSIRAVHACLTKWLIHELFTTPFETNDLRQTTSVLDIRRAKDIKAQLTEIEI
jgi:hypothetical protein